MMRRHSFQRSIQVGRARRTAHRNNTRRRPPSSTGILPGTLPVEEPIPAFSSGEVKRYPSRSGDATFRTVRAPPASRRRQHTMPGQHRDRLEEADRS